MRRRDFTIGLLIAATTATVRAQEQTNQHRIAIVRPAGAIALISETGIHFYREFFKELGDIEGRNLIVERYSGEGRPERFADLAREVVNRTPEVIVVSNVMVTGADPIQVGLATSLARPGGNITGVMVQQAGSKMDGKRLQILKDAVPSASKIAVLTMRTAWQDADGERFREAGRQLETPLTGMLLEESTPSEYQRVFAEIVQQRPDAIIVSGISELFPYRHLIVELAEQNRLPGIYPYRDYAEAGGLIAYGSDLAELWRRMADDLHQVLNGAKPSDIPIYQPTKFELLINLKAAQVLGLTIPPHLLARADEVIE